MLQRPHDFPDANKITDPDLQGHVEALFPDGLSQHGLGYLFWQGPLVSPLQPGIYDANAIGQMNSHAIELIFEFVRRTAFPDRPSRHQSIFAWETRDDAVRFAQGQGLTGAVIWEIQGECSFKADMNLLHLGTALQASFAAHSYWKGEARKGAAPHWECFLDPDAHVVRHAA
jgi:hypothetical protein